MATLIVFAKAPEAGRVKTRLIPELGSEGAEQLYRRLLRHQVEVASGVGGVRLQLCCTPASDHPCFEHLGKAFVMERSLQQGRGLGERLHHAFATHLPHGPVVVVGSDIPSLTHEDYRAAFIALGQGHSAVFTPTEDGGYGLIGLNRLDPMLFEAIDWGTERVMAQTRERLTALGWQWQELPTRWDVDEPADLERLRRDYPLLIS